MVSKWQAAALCNYLSRYCGKALLLCTTAFLHLIFTLCQAAASAKKLGCRAIQGDRQQKQVLHMPRQV